MLPRPLTVMACLAALAAGAPAQEPELPAAVQPTEDLHAEMMELIRTIEGTLVRIDLELYDAGTGEQPVEAVGDSGIEKLLLSTRGKMQSVLDGIDRIFEIRDHHEAGGTWPNGGQESLWLSHGGGGTGQSPSEGPSPLDQARDTGPTAREATPEAPGSRPGAGKPGPPPGPEPGSGPPGNDGSPTGKGFSPDPGTNRAGPPRTDSTGPAVPASPDSEAWGDLPLRIRQRFLNRATDEIPSIYRDWIDSYYRRLNRR